MTVITTLEQAELALYQAGAIQVIDLLPSVEGTKLLEVCGYSLSNTRAEIQRQIKKHGFIEDKDFTRSEDATHKGRGQKPIIYHFTVNAANHVLLAAMTPEGYDARQDAIDKKMAEEVDDPIMVQMRVIMQMREEQLAQEQEVNRLGSRMEHVEKKVQTVGEVLDNIKPVEPLKGDVVLEGWHTIPWFRIRSGNCLSENVIRTVLKNHGTPKYFNLLRQSGLIRTIHFHKEEAQKLLNQMLMESEKVSDYYRHHPWVGKFKCKLDL